MSEEKEEKSVDEYVHWNGARDDRFIRERATEHKVSCRRSPFWYFYGTVDRLGKMR